jgi:cytochrome P450
VPAHLSKFLFSRLLNLPSSFAAVGQLPWLDFLLDKNPVMRIGPPNLGNVTRIALEHLNSRLQGNDTIFDPAVPDFLQRFIDAKTTNPDLVNDGVILGYLLVNLLAGADTTAITIRAIFYYALREPDAYRRLEEEVCTAGFGTVAPFKDARALPCMLSTGGSAFCTSCHSFGCSTC